MTSAGVSPVETPLSSPSHVETGNCGEPADDALRAAGKAAKLVAAAHHDLDRAVEAARAAGHSWRAIGIVTGIPYQTLHRRPGASGGRRRQPVT